MFRFRNVKTPLLEKCTYIEHEATSCGLNLCSVTCKYFSQLQTKFFEHKI